MISNLRATRNDDRRTEQLNQEMANLLRLHEDQVKRLAEVPRLGVDLGAADHCRSGCHRSDLSFREASLLLGRRMFWG